MIPKDHITPIITTIKEINVASNNYNGIMYAGEGSYSSPGSGLSIYYIKLIDSTEHFLISSVGEVADGLIFRCI
mgnify:CR=1 FL=1